MQKKWKRVGKYVTMWPTMRARGRKREQLTQAKLKWGKGEMEKEKEEQQGDTSYKKGKDTSFVMTVSSPMVGKMHAHLLQQSGWKSRVLLHSLKQSSRTHGYPVGKKACYHPSSLHLLSPPPQASAFCLLQQAPAFPGHHVTRKQAELLYSSWKTQVKTNKPGWLFCAGAKTSWSWKSNAFLSS